MQGMPEGDMFIDSKHIPEKRCLNLSLSLSLSLSHAHDDMDAYT
jgi:hypothetical protein